MLYENISLKVFSFQFIEAEDDEEMVIGGGEGMAMSVLGEEFLNNSQDGDKRKHSTEVAPLGQSRIPPPSTLR